MLRGLSKSACGITVFDTPEKAKTCANSTTLKLYAAGIGLLLGFFILMIIVVMMFSSPITDATTVVSSSMGQKITTTNPKIEALKIRVGGTSRYSGSHYNNRNNYNDTTETGTPTKISGLGKFIWFFGTIACAVIGYMLVNENTLMSLHREDAEEIQELIGRGVPAAAALIYLKEKREDIEAARQSASRGSGLTIDL